MNLFHPTANPETGECGDPACPCHEFALKSPSEASSTENQGIEQGASEPENALQVEYGSGIAISAPDFEREWLHAPRTHTRHTEQSEAEWWFQRGLWLGIQYERERGLMALNGDLREMQRIARERIER